MSHEALSVPNDDAGPRDRQIIDAIGIEPDPRYFIPKEEIRELIRGTKAGDAEAMERLVATRLHWIYDTYTSMTEVRERRDLDVADIMQMGALATLEAGRSIDDESPIANTLLHSKIPPIMGALLVKSKLVPTITGEGIKIQQMKLIGQSERAIDNVAPIGNHDDVMGVTVEDRSAMPAEPDEIVERTVDREIVTHALEDLTPLQRYVVEARFGLGEFSSEEIDEPVSFRKIGEHFGMSHQGVHQSGQRALERIGNSYTAALRLH
jgi:RNA polymerase sigma factor (sigma-70 family)